MVRVASRLRLLYAVLLASCISQGAYGWWTLHRARLSRDEARTMYAAAGRALEAARSLVPGSSASYAPEAAEGAPERPQSLLRPSIEGTGVSGRWRYADVRHPDGERRRYYLRRDADARQTALWLARLSNDALLHQPRVEETP